MSAKPYTIDELLQILADIMSDAERFERNKWPADKIAEYRACAAEIQTIIANAKGGAS